MSGYLPPASYRAYVFDFDGTIAETGDLNLEALCAALAHAGAVVDVEWLSMEPLTSIEAVRQRLQREHGVTLACSNGAIHRMGRAYWMAHTADLRPVEEVIAISRLNPTPTADSRGPTPTPRPALPDTTCATTRTRSAASAGARRSPEWMPPAHS